MFWSQPNPLASIITGLSSRPASTTLFRPPTRISPIFASLHPGTSAWPATDERRLSGRPAQQLTCRYHPSSIVISISVPAARAGPGGRQRRPEQHRQNPPLLISDNGLSPMIDGGRASILVELNTHTEKLMWRLLVGVQSGQARCYRRNP